MISGQALKQISHTIDADLGIERAYDLPFVLEDATAKKVASYVTGLNLYANKRMNATFDLSGRNLRKNDVITLTAPRRNITAVKWKIQGIRMNGFDRYDGILRPHDADMYDDVVISSPTAWTASAGYGSLYEIPYVTVSPTAGEGMFQTIEAALAGLPSWARRIVLLRGTHPAPSTANFHAMPSTQDLEIVGESKSEVVVENKAGYPLFYIDNSSKSYKFENFTIESQNSAAASKMIHDLSTATGNTARIRIADIIFVLSLADDYGIYDEDRGTPGKMEIIGCEFTNGHAIYSESSDIWIIKNTFRDGSTHIELRYNWNVHVLDNRLIDFSSQGIYLLGLSYQDVIDSVVEGNVLESDESTAKWGIYAKYFRDCVFSDNIIKLLQTGYAYAAGLWIENGHISKISGNNVWIDQQDATDYAYGILVNADASKSSGLVISDNQLDLVNNRATYDVGISLNNADVINCDGAGNITLNVATPLYDGGSGNNVTGNDEGTPF